jgi:hypothetical protein
MNTRLSRESPIQLIVAPSSKQAVGELFWDDGESINTIESGKFDLFEFKLHPDCFIDIKVIQSGYQNSPMIDNIIVLGTQGQGIIRVDIDGHETIGESYENGEQINLPVKLDLKSKQAGQNWKVNWHLNYQNMTRCNLKH